MTYVNLRGTGGSGKTTIARRILECQVSTEWGPGYVNKFGAKRPKGFPSHLCDTPVGRVWVHGRYDVQQGGCDTEKDMDVVEANISRMIGAFPNDHHIFEGVMISKAKTRWFAFIDRHPGRWVWAWLDTPPDECVRRIMARNGGRKISDAEICSGNKTMMSQYREIRQFSIRGIEARMVGTDCDQWELFR